MAQRLPCRRSLAALLLILAVSAVVHADHLVLQVEDFDGPWRRQTNISGFLGTGFCTSNANPEIADTVMRTVVRIEQGGPHSVWVRAYTSDNSRRALQAQVNDQQLAVTHTGSERGWRWEKAGVVDLTPGEVTLIVKDAADGFESADAVVISDRPDLTPQVLEEESVNWLVYGGQAPPEADALRFVIEACCEALAGRTDPATSDEWLARADALRRDLFAALGLDPLPDRTPLNARVTGRAERDEYFIENVVFESRPGFLVTANVFIPKNHPLPAPGVVVVPGHAMVDGKNYEIYQMGQLGLVRRGFVVLGYDPIGQGERKVPGFDHDLGYGSLLVGQTNEGHIVWDTMRAADYLASRPDVDPDRLGLTGNSGGGENAFYTMPLDDRFAAGASFCFVCSYEQWLRHGGNHCICNHLPGLVHKMEQFEIVGLVAPRAFLFGNGTEDKIFPIEGTRDTLRRARRIYDMAGVGERVTLVETPAGHGWSQPLREAAYGWMTRWLMGEGDGGPLPEGSFDPEDPKSPDMLCFDDGRIPDGTETVVTLNRRLADRFRERYSVVPADGAAWQARAEGLREDLWAVFGGRPPEFAPQARVLKTFRWETRTVEAVALTTEPGMETACFFITPDQASPDAPVLLYVSEDDKSAVRNDPLAAALLDAGWAVLALDPRGMGETAGNVVENHLVSDTVCLGRPLFAQRVWDIIQAARYAKSRRPGAALACFGSGGCGLLGVFAAALEAPFERVAAVDTLASYRFYLEDRQTQPLWLCVPNILKVADIPQVVALAAPAPVLLANPIGYELQPLGRESAAAETAFPREVYGLVGSPERFTVIEGAPPELRPALEAFLRARP